MLSIENEIAPEPLASEDVAQLYHIDDFYIDTHFETDKILPRIVTIGGKVYYRFMDFIYLPERPDGLNTQQIIEICDLRLQYMDRLVVSQINDYVVAEAVACAKGDWLEPSAPLSALDFGCGSGLSSLLLKKHWPELSIVGVDISEKAIARSREQNLDAHLIHPEKPLPFPDASFDVIFAIFVMHFSVDVFALSELKRILRPARKFVFNVYQRDIAGVIKQLGAAGFGSIEVKEIAGAGKTHRMVTCTPLPSQMVM